MAWEFKSPLSHQEKKRLLSIKAKDVSLFPAPEQHPEDESIFAKNVYHLLDYLEKRHCCCYNYYVLFSVYQFDREAAGRTEEKGCPKGYVHEFEKK